MKWFMRGLSASLLCVGMLGVLGCGPDNETEANRGTAIGDPGKPDPKGMPATIEPPPKSQAEAYERQKKKNDEMFKGGYGGAKK
ncbi:MAG: hypothetical protein ACLQIB_13830 [Isosphaeraceae bacterium]